MREYFKDLANAEVRDSVTENYDSKKPALIVIQNYDNKYRFE